MQTKPDEKEFRIWYHAPTMIHRDTIERWLHEHGGVLTAKSAIVCRNTYFGKDIIAQNSSLSYADDRGYVPVELWIMSMVEAENTIPQAGEGLTVIDIDGNAVTLKELGHVAHELIFGKYASEWPLTKILDIGGKPVKTSFGTVEIPPIPVHVHPRKTEAYFFPKTDVPPYNHQEERVVTRIGLKAGVTKEEFKARLARFGEDDSMFELLNEFPIEPMTGWTVLEKTLHAPGPYVTFEIQRPADDYANASWRLGERLHDTEKDAKYTEHVLRETVTHVDEYIEKVLDWEHTSDQELRNKYFHTPKELATGDWGRRYQIFFDMFYGEGWEIARGQTMILDPKEYPQAGIVWSGRGTLNLNEIGVEGKNEFLITPNTRATITNTGDTTLVMYSVEPIRTI